MYTNLVRMFDKHENKYSLYMEIGWRTVRCGPFVRAYLRDASRNLVAFADISGFEPDAIEWAEGEIAAMSRHDGGYYGF